MKKHMEYGYVRVSSRDQNEDRQMIAMRAGRKGNDLRPAFCAIITIIQLPDPRLSVIRIITEIDKTCFRIQITGTELHLGIPLLGKIAILWNKQMNLFQ